MKLNWHFAPCSDLAYVTFVGEEAVAGYYPEDQKDLKGLWSWEMWTPEHGDLVKKNFGSEEECKEAVEEEIRKYLNGKLSQNSD